MPSPMDLSALRKDILAEDGQTLYIRKESETDILTDDIIDSRYINYHLTPVTAEWLQSRFLWAPSCQDLQRRYETTCISLLLSLDANMLINLNRIIFLSNEDDITYICKQMNLEEYEFPDNIDFENNNLVGLHWYAESSIIINWQTIKDVVLEMESWETATGEDIGVYTTLTHEIRHLGLANPFLPEGNYPNSEQTEQAVEQWGLRAFEAWKHKT